MQRSSQRCHVHHQGTILPYLQGGHGSFQGGCGSFQGGPPLLSHTSGWGPQEIPIDLPPLNRTVQCTPGTFSNGSPVPLSDWSQCFTSSEFKRASLGG